MNPGGGSPAGRRVLYVAHNHPSIRPGGMEAYAEELCRAMAADGGFEPTMLSRIGRPHSRREPHPDTRFALAETYPNLYYLHTDIDEFDRLLWAAHDKRLYTQDWVPFLRALDPDVVHFHHSLFLGYDMLRATRAAVPRVPIVYTLHEFVPICHHGGQMVRTTSLELCSEASPRRCHGCFPEISPQRFLLRERFIKSAFEEVDLFIVPSEDGRQRYLNWGLEPERIVCENYGRLQMMPLPDPPDAGRRHRIAFIGRITPFKGVDVLLEAIRIIQQRGTEVELEVHGANLDMQPAAFQERVADLLAQTAASVRFAGPYKPSELARILAAVDWVVVPSLWWETGPLVIAEALMHRRPVICSDIGSMVERIEDGVNGLHFRAGDAASLAGTIERAVRDPDLWDRLRSQIVDPHPMQVHLKTITDHYNRLLACAAPAQAT